MMGGYGQGLGWGMMGGWFGWLSMLFFGLLVIAGFVLLVIWAVRMASDGGQRSGSDSSQSHTPHSAGQDEAITIARRRLASGDITAEQYAEIIRTLGA